MIFAIMINPEHFAHYFEFTAHLNFFTLAFIYIGYTHVIDPFINRENELKTAGLNSSFYLHESFDKYRKRIDESSNPVIKLFHTIIYAIVYIWGFLIYKIIFSLIIGIFEIFSGQGEINAYKDKIVFFQRFGPVFFASGIFCVVMMVVPQLKEHYLPIHHECSTIILTITTAYLLYFILYMIARIQNISGWIKIIFINFALIVACYFISKTFISQIEYKKVHSFIDKNQLLVFFINIGVALFPLLFLLLKLISRFLPLGLRNIVVVKFNKYGNTDLSNRGFPGSPNADDNS